MDKKFTFEEIFQQNEKRIHYQIHKLHIRDPHNEFYIEGLYAMWLAYKNYQPDKGPMATYFNYVIRNRLIDLIRNKNKEQIIDEAFVQKENIDKYDGNHSASSGPIISTEEIEIVDEKIWNEVQEILSPNQWKWVNYYVVQDLSQKEIAEREGVSIDAVKGWSREARRKLRASEILY